VALVGVVLLAQGVSLRRREAARPVPSQVAVEPALLAWVGKHVRPEEAIMVVGDAQPVGYQLQRPTVGIPPHQYSVRSWDSLEVREALARYRVQAVIVARERHDASYGPFFDRLIAGDSPAWLVPALTTQRARVYLIRPMLP
jgi:hypothetical protein